MYVLYVIAMMLGRGGGGGSEVTTLSSELICSIASLFAVLKPSYSHKIQ